LLKSGGNQHDSSSRPCGNRAANHSTHMLDMGRTQPVGRYCLKVDGEAAPRAFALKLPEEIVVALVHKYRTPGGVGFSDQQQRAVRSW